MYMIHAHESFDEELEVGNTGIYRYSNSKDNIIQLYNL